MKTTDLRCADVELRLVDGRPVAEDAEVAAHVRSCLRCFRAASELREAPRLAALLRQGQADEQPDPGDLFWARFPKTVADAWERQHQPVPTAAPAWRRASGWFRKPLPAALSGAAVAAALVLLVMHRAPAPMATDRTPTADRMVTDRTPTAPEAPAVGDEDGPAGLLGEDDPLDSLELADTQLVAKVGEPEVQGSDDGELSPSPAEELELLETDDLRAVVQALHGRSI